MMQDLAFALRIMDLNGLAYPAILRERLMKAAEYACDFVFGNDGDTPCWGANDGAHVFRLSECGYRDFRPHIQTVGAGFSGERYFPIGQWDEETLWFFGKEALDRYTAISYDELMLGITEIANEGDSATLSELWISYLYGIAPYLTLAYLTDMA